MDSVTVLHIKQEAADCAIQLPGLVRTMNGLDCPIFFYFSQRAIPLVYTGKPGEKPILTVENYCKWYTLYAVFPDGRVRPVDYSEYGELELKSEAHGGVSHLWSDHIPYPPSCEKIAEHLGMDWDDQSLEMIHGRYQLEKVL